MESKFDTSLRIYFIIAFINLMAIFFAADWLAMVTRPLMIPVLWVAFFQVTKNVFSPVRYLILFALFFSWIGDISMALQAMDSLFFFIGSVLFLIAYIIYAVAFFTEIRNRKMMLAQRPWLVVIGFAYGFGFPLLFRKQLDDMLVPVILYECIVTIMILMAFSRFNVSGNKSFQQVFAGVIFFLLSDSLAEINRFVQPFILGSFLIMFAYILAQVLIMKGIADQYAFMEEKVI
ncbi:MAG: lysoplasmalogenase [Chitinophagales bacterium]|nr:lysoplasmalogenase [Chitinophagales bacterium]